jgi:uncharacterized protein (TIGR01777 family)
VVQWDAATPGPWAAAVDGAGAVINLAGQSVAGRRWSEEYKRQIRESRLASTRALVGAIGAARVRPRVFLCASAVGFYGDRGDQQLDESAGPGRDFLAGVCADWEREAAAAAALPPAQGAEPVRVVQLRTGVVLAPPAEGGALAKMVTPFQLFAGGPLGSGRQWFPWIHLDDEVAAIVWSLDHAEVHGPTNLVAPGAQTMADFCRTLGQVLRRPSWAPVPAVALRLLVGEMAEVLLGGQRAVPAQLTRTGFRFRYTESAAALRAALEHPAPAK